MAGSRRRHRGRVRRDIVQVAKRRPMARHQIHAAQPEGTSLWRPIGGLARRRGNRGRRQAGRSCGLRSVLARAGWHRRTAPLRGLPPELRRRTVRRSAPARLAGWGGGGRSARWAVGGVAEPSPGSCDGGRRCQPAGDASKGPWRRYARVAGTLGVPVGSWQPRSTQRHPAASPSSSAAMCGYAISSRALTTDWRQRPR